ncbi:MAG: hypothetical protein ACYC1Z_15020, partial [Georgenia sp.]
AKGSGSLARPLHPPAAMTPLRTGRILGIWLAALGAELLLWWFFVRSSYFRELFMPVTVMVAIAALAATARAVRRRERQRRGGERRSADRRD